MCPQKNVCQSQISQDIPCSLFRPPDFEQQTTGLNAVNLRAYPTSEVDHNSSTAPPSNTKALLSFCWTRSWNRTLLKQKTLGFSAFPAIFDAALQLTEYGF